MYNYLDSPYIQKSSDDHESFQAFSSVATFLTNEKDIMHDNTYVLTTETGKYLKVSIGLLSNI